MAYQALILRNPARAAATVQEFEQLGITSWCAQLIDTVWPENRSQLHRMGEELVAGRFSWLVLTSVNTVHVVAQVLDGRQLPADLRIASVGQKTTGAISRLLGRSVHFQPAEQSAAGMVAEWRLEAGERICYPHGDLASSTLADGLAEHPVEVSECIAYETVDAGRGGQPVTEAVAVPGIKILPAEQIGATLEELDLVVFSAPSVVRRFIQLAGSRLPSRTQAIAIGKPTAAAMERAGLPVHAISAQPTPQGLARAAQDLLRRTGPSGAAERTAE
ncbi:uroporphyrinogen-III synthase [Glutamicibacter nicotianae]|uniref:uroporphyrinogen-III synthase n=1 Tax=Glutamicibacter nicotianae TaxID=37929 RepID=UPI00195CFD56|nr:uroporphyrinogen-III synthase [Glutamicibacter nicotianae]MBM7768944.1 uroporphyrinogen-III synthase [Glutamicibacter nicotianae]